MWRRCNLRRSGLHTRPASTRSLLPDSASRGRCVLQHICRGASSTNLTSEELAPMVDGWTVNGWVESQAVPYNTISGWDPDHWFELPLDNEHLFQSIRLQNFPTRIIPGRLFTTRMPRSLDTKPHAATRFAEKARLAQLDLVIVLTEVEEYLEYAGTSSLIDYYNALGAKVLARPIPDFGVPSRELLAEVINVATLALADGENVLVHCAGGSGRTGIVVCGVLRNLGVHDTIAWARRQKSTYVETEEQQAVLESMPLTITAELVQKHPVLVEAMAAEMGALAVSRARAGSFDTQATIDPSMLDAYQALWNALDADENGLVEITAAASEVEAVLAEHAEGAHLESAVSRGVSVRQLLGAVDLDGDDAVSFSEFCLVMSQPLLPPLSEVVIEQHAAAAAESSGGSMSTADAVAAAKQLARTFEEADSQTQSNILQAIGPEMLKAMATFRMRSRL